MKKILLFVTAVLTAVSMSAASYGIMVNGTDYHRGDHNPAPLDPSFDEYAVLNVTLAAGDHFQLYDQENQVGWAVPLDPAVEVDVTVNKTDYTMNVAGTYNFYIKLKFQNDQLWIELAQGGEQGGGGQGGGQTGQLYYYLKESGMGSPSADELFENGILANYNLQATDPSGKAYIFLIISTTEGSAIGNQYMTKAYVDGGTSAQFFPDGVSQYEKWGLTPGTYTFYLYKDEGDSYTISTEPIAGRTVVDAAKDGVEEVKMLLDLNQPMYNILGQQVDASFRGIVLQAGRKYIR